MTPATLPNQQFTVSHLNEDDFKTIEFKAMVFVKKGDQ